MYWSVYVDIQFVKVDISSVNADTQSVMVDIQYVMLDIQKRLDVVHFISPPTSPAGRKSEVPGRKRVFNSWN